MKLRRIEVRETICRPFQRARFREVTRKALPVVSFVFPHRSVAEERVLPGEVQLARLRS